MKIKALLAGSALALTASFALAGGEGWNIDFEAAKKQAAKEKKDLLVDFTGSDWCGWCIKLKKEVFDHDPFKKGVADSLVLVELDYPRDKSKLSEDTQKQNAKLKDVYQPAGFPTILLMDAEGLPYAKTGYQQGGPEQYVSHLNELREIRVKRDAAMTKAADQKGVEKAKALVAALALLDEELVSVHYKKVTAEIATLDPKDETGFVAKQKKKELMGGFEKELMDLFRSGKMDAVPAKVDKFIADNKIEGEDKQNLLGMKINVSLQAGDFVAAEKVLDAIIAVNPDNRFGKQAADFKASPRYAQMKEKAAAKGKDEEKKDK